jgi:antitoxin component YwqK of YwqJK toxin-antitoxin module
VLHGQARFYYEGTKYLQSAGNNHNGTKEGLWFFYKNIPTKEVNAMYHFSFGLYQGAYYTIKNDTIEKGAYTNNKLEGEFKRYSFKVAQNGVDTLLTIIDEGSYKNGLKNGLWKHYINGRLNKEGTYRDDKMDMQWKEYDLLSDVNKPEVMREMRYEKGVLEGKWIQNFTYENGKKTIIQIDAFYHYGKLNGKYLSKDDFGILAEGDYSEGFKMGQWKERIKEKIAVREANYFDDKLVGKVVYKNMAGKLIKEGNYKNGIMEGKWIEYDNNQNKIKEETYSIGKLNGETIKFNSSGIVQTVSVFENDKLVTYKIYNPSGTDVVGEYSINGGEKAASPYSINVEEVVGDTMYASVYVNTGKLPEDVLTNFPKYKTSLPLTGAYEKKSKDKVIESGYYTNNVKDGVWQYFYNPNVLWEAVYSNGTITKETFIETASKTPFKGDYTVLWSNGKMRFEFKIKNGLRNGKSKWFDTNENAIKEIKYNEGKQD